MICKICDEYFEPFKIIGETLQAESFICPQCCTVQMALWRMRNQSSGREMNE